MNIVSERVGTMLERKIIFTIFNLSLLILFLSVMNGRAVEFTLGNKRLVFLPEKSQEMFPRLYADPYDTQLGLVKILEEDQFIGRIGQSFYLFHLHLEDAETGTHRKGMYLGLTGYSWTLLDREQNKFPLMAVDYLIAGFLDFHFQKVAFRVKYSHISAHLGDKFFQGSDTFILPRVYSREFINIYVSRRLGPVVPYGAIQWIYHSIPDVDPVNYQFGITLDFGEPVRPGFRPYMSADFQIVSQFDYQINSSIQIGSRLFYQDGKSYRLALTYYNGHHEFGQYFDQTTSYTSLGFYLDY